MTTWIWTGLLVFAVLMIALTLGIFHRKARKGLTGLAVLTYKNARRVVIFLVGVSVLLVGVAMIVLPGPAILVIPAGLAILATEFAWARDLLRRMKDKARDLSGAANAIARRSDGEVDEVNLRLRPVPPARLHSFAGINQQACNPRLRRERWKFDFGARRARSRARCIC